MSSPVFVLDASVGVKWFRFEAGSAEAKHLLTSHFDGDVLLAVDALFAYELLAVMARERDAAGVRRVWQDLAAADLSIVPLGEELVAAAAEQRERLGCSLYDAFSAGLASLLRAPLVSADARAHGGYPDVRLLGE